MAELSNIPTPPSQRLREFRVTYVPAIVFACTLIAIVVMWRSYVAPPTLVGQVEPLVSSVTSRNAGVLTNLLVQRFQEVKAGDIIAEVWVTDHRRYDTELELLRSQISLAQLELGTMADRQRLALEYENLRVNYMRQQADLEMAKAELPHAQFDVDLSSKLLGDKVVSEFEYHYFLSSYDSLKAKVAQMTKSVEQLEKVLLDSKEIVETAPGAAGTKRLMDRLADLQSQQARLELLGVAPLRIEASISGVITDVLRHPGENLLPGDPIVTISARQSERIVGYLHAPLAIQPKMGMTVQVRTRTTPRAEGEARISGIGAALEIIRNPAFLRPNAPAELGLPVAVSIPANLRRQLRPGELLDVVIRPD